MNDKKINEKINTERTQATNKNQYSKVCKVSLESHT